MDRAPRPFVVGAGVVFVLLGAIGFVPLFGGPGYEHALASGLFVPAAAAIANAVSTARRDSPTPLASVGRGILAGGAYAVVALATALLHAARIGICELWGALLYFGLTAGFGALLGGAWGAICGELTGLLVARRRVRRLRLVATSFALAGPLAGVIVSLYRFHSSPMIFAFDPFVGYFSGTLYDTVIDAGSSLLTYRLGTFATLVALGFGASVLVRDDGRPLGLAFERGSAGSRARALLAALAGATSIGLVVAGPWLGHFSTSASITKDLGAEKHGRRCDVVYPATTREQEANLILRDCEQQLVAVETRLQTRGPMRVRAFFFRDENDKKRLMGAAHTYIAKPWREEVYLQVGAYRIRSSGTSSRTSSPAPPGKARFGSRAASAG